MTSLTHDVIDETCLRLADFTEPAMR